MGVTVTAIDPVSGGNGYANKLAQLGSPALGDAKYVVLCDCDIAFAGDISEHVRGEAMRGKVVDAGRPNVEEFARVLQLAGMPPDITPYRASHAHEDTDVDNWNGGLYVIPQPVFQSLIEEWPRWDRWMLRRAARFTDGKGMYSDQVALALATRSLGVKTEPLPTTLNFPTHVDYEGNDREEIEPVVLHYHDRLDDDGLLLTTGMTGVDIAITRVNRSIATMPAEARQAGLTAVRQWRSSQGQQPPRRRWLTQLYRRRSARLQ
ncbi:MAG: hypothetical protein QOK05_1379 [Chloroflexota bacterium]|nr:hypothetical protein [Chloroflexota bacterium]